jgi:glycosyltransferase involved in cell wall biosynthesis
VLHVAQPTIDGVAVCVERLARAQQASGWRVAVACPDDGPLAPALRAAGVTVYAWSAGRHPGPAVIIEANRLARVVRATAPDLVHLHSSKAGLAGRLAIRGQRPTVFHPHAWSFAAVGGVTGRAALAWERLAARWTDRVLCCSEGERAEGERAGVHVKTEVVGNGVDLSAFPYAGAADRAAARGRLGLGDGPLAVCVGRLSPQKGQDMLLDAWPAVVAAVPGARLVLVGEGPDAAALRARGRAGVSLVGRRHDVADWQAAADVVVVPSRYEGLSLTALEAMATGRSVVAHAVEGMDELLRDGAGAVVEVGDRAALAGAVSARLLDPSVADAEGRRARAVVEAHHSIDAWIARVLDATESVLAASRA